MSTLTDYACTVGFEQSACVRSHVRVRVFTCNQFYTTWHISGTYRAHGNVRAKLQRIDERVHSPLGAQERKQNLPTPANELPFHSRAAFPEFVSSSLASRRIYISIRSPKKRNPKRFFPLLHFVSPLE